MSDTSAGGSGGDPAWTVLPQASASTPLVYSWAAQQAQSTGGQRRGRITHEGSRLIDEAYEANPSPSMSEKRELLERLKALPGCEHYTFESLQSMFASRRSRDGLTRAATKIRKIAHPVEDPSTVDEILYPSLAQPQIMRSLNILTQQTPDPPPAQVKIWASRLGVDYNDIQTWLQCRKVSKQLKESKPMITSQLPTPESSCSPEPPSKSVQQHVCASRKTNSTGSLAVLTSEQMSDLAERIHAAQTQSDTPHLSPQEAIKCMEEHEQRMKAFLEKAERGDYAAIGIDPYLARADKNNVWEDAGLK